MFGVTTQQTLNTGASKMTESHAEQDFNESYLSTLSPSDARFDKLKGTSQEMSRLYGLETSDGFTGFFAGSQLVSFEKYSVKIEKCGSWLRFVQDSDGKLKLVDARFCKVPNCSMCQQRRAMKWRAKFLTLVPQIREKYPTHKFLFLTLTIRNCDIEVLRDTLTRLNGSFKRLSELKRFPMDGLVKSVEVTRAWDCYHKGTFLGRHGTRWIVKWEYKNKSKLDLQPTSEVHPHLHVCGLVPASYFSTGYISQQEWTELWQQSLRVDYKPIVHITAVKFKNKEKGILSELENTPTAEENRMLRAMCETLKYTVKESDLIGSCCQDDEANATWLKLMTQQLYKARKVEYKGTLKEIGKELEAAYNDDNLIDIKDEKDESDKDPNLKELVFVWMKRIEKYVMSDVDSEQ